MVEFENNTIIMTRGDTLRAQLEIRDEAGQAYTIQEGDAVRFAMKRSEMNAKATEYRDREPLAMKTIPTDTLVLKLDPEDTEGLPFGDYDYDIQLTCADGTVDTIIADALTLTREVD